MNRRAAILTLVMLSSCTPDEVSPQFGGSCIDNNQCAAPATCLPTSSFTPAGFCTIACTTDTECDPSAACAMVPNVAGSVCLLSCRDNRDCEILQSDDQDNSWTCQQQINPNGDPHFVCLGE